MGSVFMKRDARKDKENSKNNELSKSFFKSYLQFFLLIVFSVVLIGFIAFFSAKSALTTLGQTAIRNRVQMGLAIGACHDGQPGKSSQKGKDYKN
jgi:methyl-accepting chemotaxis protein